MAVVLLISIILLSPLAAFAFFGLLSLKGRNFARQDLVSTVAMLIAATCSFLLLSQISSHPEPIALTWINISEISLSMGFYFDSVTAIMLLVVTIVSSLVHVFSMSYMHGDPRYPRFFAFLSLFSFSMLFLVVSDNLLGIYIGWELVGLCSYLLIGFWFEKDSAANACKKAFLTTRIGDVGMFVGMMMLFTKFGTFALYGEGGIFALVANLGDGDMLWLSIAGILVFCGAIGKSAQVPLHTWLPDAMEGPTPVSALIHAATMVAAGVYLTARMFPILTPGSSLAIAYVGGVTALLAATIAIVRFDIKRVLAYSTISQLGYMMLAIGAGSYVAGLFHLTTHAFFKALLFLGSGSVIHALHVRHDSHNHESEAGDDDAIGFNSFGIPAEQDMRHMGGLRHKMPITFLTMLIATLSISGVPFLFSGFWSKDAVLGGVLERAMEWGSIHYYILFVLALGAAGLTAFYMFRLIFMTFFGEPRNKEMYDQAHESNALMTVPLILLAVLSMPVVNKWSFETYIKAPKQPHVHASEHVRAGQSHPILMVDAGADDVHVVEDVSHDNHHDGNIVAVGHHGHSPAHSIAMVLSIVVAGLGILLSWLFYHRRAFSPESAKSSLFPIYNMCWNKYYFDEFYNGVLVAFTIGWGKVLKVFDSWVVDGVVNAVAFLTRAVFAAISGWFDNTFVDGLVNAVGKVIWGFGGRVRRIQTGAIQNYLLMILGGVVLLILIFRQFL